MILLVPPSLRLTGSNDLSGVRAHTCFAPSGKESSLSYLSSLGVHVCTWDLSYLVCSSAMGTTSFLELRTNRSPCNGLFRFGPRRVTACHSPSSGCSSSGISLRGGALTRLRAHGFPIYGFLDGASERSNYSLASRFSWSMVLVWYSLDPKRRTSACAAFCSCSTAACLSLAFFKANSC